MANNNKQETSHNFESATWQTSPDCNNINAENTNCIDSNIGIFGNFYPQNTNISVILPDFVAAAYSDNSNDSIVEVGVVVNRPPQASQSFIGIRTSNNAVSSPKTQPQPRQDLQNPIGITTSNDVASPQIPQIDHSQPPQELQDPIRVTTSDNTILPQIPKISLPQPPNFFSEPTGGETVNNANYCCGDATHEQQNQVFQQQHLHNLRHHDNQQVDSSDGVRSHLFKTIQLLSDKYDSLLAINTEIRAELVEKELELTSARDKIKEINTSSSIKSSIDESLEFLSAPPCIKKEESQTQHQSVLLARTRCEYERNLAEINTGLVNIYEKVVKLWKSPSNQFPNKKRKYNDNEDINSINWSTLCGRSLDNYSPVSDWSGDEVVEVDKDSGNPIGNGVLGGQYETAKKTLVKIQTYLDIKLNRGTDSVPVPVDKNFKYNEQDIEMKAEEMPMPIIVGSASIGSSKGADASSNEREKSLNSTISTATLVFVPVSSPMTNKSVVHVFPPSASSQKQNVTLSQSIPESFHHDRRGVYVEKRCAPNNENVPTSNHYHHPAMYNDGMRTASCSSSSSSSTTTTMHSNVTACKDNDGNVENMNQPQHTWDMSKSSPDGKLVWCTCGSRYKSRVSLQAHIKSQSEEALTGQPKRFVCGSCNKGYVHFKGLKYHMETCHNLTL